MRKNIYNTLVAQSMCIHVVVLFSYDVLVTHDDRKLLLHNVSSFKNNLSCRGTNSIRFA